MNFKGISLFLCIILLISGSILAQSVSSGLVHRKLVFKINEQINYQYNDSRSFLKALDHDFMSFSIAFITRKSNQHELSIHDLSFKDQFEIGFGYMHKIALIKKQKSFIRPYIGLYSDLLYTKNEDPVPAGSAIREAHLELGAEPGFQIEIGRIFADIGVRLPLYNGSGEWNPENSSLELDAFQFRDRMAIRFGVGIKI